MIRILMFGVSYLAGGVENFLYNYVSRLQKTENFQIDFLSIHKKLAFEDEFRSMGCSVLSVPDARQNPFKACSKMASVMAGGNYDILHINMLSAANITPLLAGKKAGIPHIIAHSHNAQIPPGLLRKILHTCNRPKLPSLADTFFACSDAAGRWLFPSGQSFQIIHNAIDEKKFRYKPEIRKEMRLRLNLENNLVLGHVGRFQYQKNHDFLLDIFHQIVLLRPDARLILIGTGELMPAVREKVSRLHLDHSVIFAGAQNNIPDWLQAMDAAVLPSHFEGLPLTAIEAQASGLPLFASDAVSSEICITPLAHRLSLTLDAGVWARKILSSVLSAKRKDTSGMIRSSGYSIDSESRHLADLYRSILRQ